MTRLLDPDQLDQLNALLRSAGYAAVLCGIEEIALHTASCRPGGDVTLEGVARELRPAIVLAAVMALPVR